MKAFYRLLGNSLASGVTSTFLWFAVTFWVYLQTRSVVATAVIGAAFSAASALLGMVFGTFVDRQRKHHVMLVSSTAALGCYIAAAAVYAAVDQAELLAMGRPWFWLFIALILLGTVAGNLRGIALGTCVTLLVPEDRRERANGMVGTIMGVSFAITSVFSGLVVGQLGMGWAMGLAVAIGAAVVAHLMTVPIPEPHFQPPPPDGRSWIDFAGARQAIAATSGLMGLIFFSAFNNLLGGVFMSLMDAYGLSMMSVESWGLLWGVLSFGFIVGGLVVARWGLGGKPLRLVLAGNLVGWTVCSLFALRSSVLTLAIGMFVWLVFIPIIEAAEQTVLQQTVPFDAQGRVFGFAQTVENLGTPLTAFLIGPLAETIFIPYMTTGSGVDLIGGWFGTGPERGIALVFTIAGVVGVVATVGCRLSRSYALLSQPRPEPIAAERDPKLDVSRAN